MRNFGQWYGRVFIIVLLTSSPQTLLAKSSLQSVFESIYSNSSSTETADCQTCHTSSTFQLNAYGNALCDQLTDEVTSMDRVLSFEARARAVEGVDSDGDGYSNIEEINDSAQPGWTLGGSNPSYQMTFNTNECVATGAVESPPSWIPGTELDPQPADNVAPVAVNDTDSTPMNTPITVDVLANDTDSNGDSISVLTTNAGAGAHGSVVNNASDVTYTPDSDFCGTAIFQYQITDGSAPSNLASATISVGDAVAPVVTAPLADLELSILAGNTQVPASNTDIVNWLATASANDAQDGALTVNVNAPSNFEAGTTTVVFSAIDSCGNSSTATADVIVTVENNNSPVVTAPVPDPLTLTAPLCATSLASADPGIANWLLQATASDVEDGSLSVSNTAPLSIPLGDTTVVFSSTDSLGATGTESAVISVNATPNSAPEVEAPSPISITVSASTTSVPISNSDIQEFLSDASAEDAEDDDLIVTHDAPAAFGLGTTTVTFQATDDCGLSSTSQSTVTIIADLTNNPPSISAPAPIELEEAFCAGSLSITAPLVSAFLDSATASDDEDGDLSASIIHDAPANLTVTPAPGALNVITFSVTDSGDPSGTPLTSTTTSRITLTDTNVPPTLVAPVAITTAIPNASIPATDPIITSFLASAVASDTEDGSLTYSNNAPAVFEPGITTVTFTTTDSCGLHAISNSTVTIPIDSTAPVISLLGNNPINIGQFDPFEDPGATAIDNFDGDVTASIVASGTVNNAVIGAYTISYNVSDASGNAADTVTRTVNVTDSIAPVITLLGNSPVEVAQGSVFTDPGATASDNIDGDITANIITSGIVNTAVIGTYTISYNVSDAAGNAATAVVRTIFVTPPDTTAPIITLLGSNPINIERNVAFHDPGATAIDDVDGNISASITVSGSVDQMTVGTYVLSYNVSDAAGNAAVTITRTVNVTAPPDTETPVISLLGNNPINLEQGTPFTDPGATASDNVDGDITGNISVSGSVDVMTVGTYHLWYNVTDAAGNAAVTATRTVNITPPPDTIAPVITLLGSNPFTIELGATFTDPGATASDNVDGNITASIVTTGNVNINVIGSYTRTYNVSDAAGNAAVTVTRTVNVTAPADTTPPVITLLGNNPLNIEQGATFTDPGATASDNLDGNISANIVATGTVNTAVVGSYTRSYNVSDAAGNAAITVTRTVNVTSPADTTPPVITLLGSNPLNIVQGATFTDPGASASDNVDGNISANIVTTGTVNTAVIGSYTRSYNVSDAAGNAAITVIRTVNVIVPADTTPPVITLLGGNPLSLVQGATFTDPGATANDNVDGSITANIVTSGTVNTAVVGSYTLSYNVSDAAGNAASTATRTVNITSPADTTPPVITLIGSNPFNIIQGATFSDPGANANDNVDGNISASIVATGNVNTAVIGSYTRTYNVADAAGNAAATVTRVVNVTAPADTTPPVITVLGSNPFNVEQGASFTDLGASANDNVDGNITASIVATGTVNTSVAGSYVRSYNVSDAAGNAAVTVTRMINVQPAAAPVISLSGHNPLEIFVGGTYTEPGYSATDNVDGNITANVSVNASAVNTNAVGTYQVTYNVSDAAGNAATTATRTVNVVSATSTYTANPALAVGAASVSTTLFIADDRQIADLNVFIDMPHAYPGDVSIILTSPAGTSVTIVDGPGKPASTWGCSRDNFLVTLDDEGSGNVEDACSSTLPAISGTLIPNNPLSAFDGESSQGTWTLRLDDSYTSADTGTLNSWSLIITAEEIAAPDTIAPMITLSGDNPLEIPVGGTYSEPGYSATDNIDGNITGAVSVNSSAVNTSSVGSYTVVYSVSDTAGNSASILRWVNVTSGPDTTAPVINLFGNNPLDITQNSTYSDPGYSAVDNVDGNITASVIVDASAVNTSNLGSYVVTYNVSDAAGNAATTVTRTVNVIIATDTTPPVISLLGANPVEIMVGGSYSEPGYSASDDFDGNITANVSVNASAVNTNVEGSYQVTYNVSDAAGNAATTATRTVNVVSATSTYTANPNLNVGAASVSTTLFIADDRQIADLNVFIDMPHAYPGDVSIILISPSGTRVTIVDGPGKPASTWGCSRDNFLVTLDDEGSGNVEDACSSTLPAISGTLIPNNALSAFDGESSQGTWTLQLDDSYTSADTGTLNSWSLIITAEQVTPSVDTTPPVITLLGNAVIDLQNGDTFNDPGATAMDNVDGNISANISVSGAVNVNINGSYILTYNVQDAAGNAATSVSRTVNVTSISTVFAEAETGTIGGSHNIVNNHAGFTGSGFVDYVGEGYMEYTFDGSAVPYALTIRYALGGGNRPLEVILNGVSVGTVSFPATGSWTTWLSTAPLLITPSSGTNTLRLQTTGSSGANVDSLTLTPQ